MSVLKINAIDNNNISQVHIMYLPKKTGFFPKTFYSISGTTYLFAFTAANFIAFSMKPRTSGAISMSCSSIFL